MRTFCVLLTYILLISPGNNDVFPNDVYVSVCQSVSQSVCLSYHIADVPLSLSAESREFLAVCHQGDCLEMAETSHGGTGDTFHSVLLSALNNSVLHDGVSKHVRDDVRLLRLQSVLLCGWWPWPYCWSC